MVNKYIASAAALAALTVSAAAEDVRVEKDLKCTTTENGNQKTVICHSGDGSDWAAGGGVAIAPHGGANQDVDVQVMGDGKTERRVVIFRRVGPDSADENKDGKVSRKEFLARAEKHFADLDRDRNGVLEKDELHPPMPPLPPGVPPIPPIPPVPPVPPVPPAPSQN